MKDATIRVWDLPTRLFHWALVVCLAGMFATAYLPAGTLVWHSRLGYAVLTLLLFRVVWGFVGGHWSRFSTFFPSPGRLLRHLRGNAAEPVGHNPLGALSIFAMLAVLFVQVGTGLVGDDEIAFTGPLNRFVSSSAGLAATSWHKTWGQWLVIGMIGLHLAAIAVYAFVLRRNLVPPMVHGQQRADDDVPASRDDARTRTLALVVLAACAGAVALIARQG